MRVSFKSPSFRSCATSPIRPRAGLAVCARFLGSEWITANPDITPKSGYFPIAHYPGATNKYRPRNMHGVRVLRVTTSRKWMVIATLAGLVSLITFVVVYRSKYAAPPFNVTPLPKSAHALTPAEVEQILSADFILIRRVQQIPAPVKADYTAFANEPFEMVNPGQTRSTDAIIPGVPNKELVFVGLAERNAVLVFKRGGLFDTTNAAVFSHSGTGGVWTARIDDSSGQDIAALRNAVHNRRFEPWDADFLFAHPPK